MFNRGRRRFGGTTERSVAKSYKQEENGSNEVEHDTIQLHPLEPAAQSQWRSLKEENERRRSGKTYSSRDVEEFEPLLVENGRQSPDLKRPASVEDNTHGLQRILKNMSSSRGSSSPALKPFKKLPEKVSLPKLLLDGEELKLDEDKESDVSCVKKRMANNLSLEGDCDTGRCRLKPAECSQVEDSLFEITVGRTDKHSPKFLRPSHVVLESTSDRCGISRKMRRNPKRYTKGKNEPQFLDIFTENDTFSKCVSKWLGRETDNSNLTADAKSKFEEGEGDGNSYRDKYEDEQISETLHQNEDCILDGPGLLKKLSQTSESFSDKQSEKSFVLVVDQLSDVRVRNKFVRQYAGRRRMAICEELEKVLVWNGHCLHELRRELNIDNVLNNMFS